MDEKRGGDAVFTLSVRVAFLWHLGDTPASTLLHLMSFPHPGRVKHVGSVVK
jgi:hypothetical protein